MNNKMKNKPLLINVVGLGYIGLPTALMLAAHGNRVVGTDYNKELVEKLSHNQITFEEKNLLDLFEKACDSGIRFSTAYQKADVYIIAVPTPYLKINRKINPQYVVKAVKSVLKVCSDDAVIVIESTISPGTIEQCVRPLVGDRPIRLAHAPERIIPGNMIYELVNNSRTIGSDDPETGEMIKSVYSSFCKGQINLTDIKTAEMSKVVENTFRDINIAYANELSRICHEAGLDVYEVIRIANCHPRVNILTPGPGVGGHCISVDPWFLVGDYPELTPLIQTARKTNDSQPEYILKIMHEIMEAHNLTDAKRVGLYGLTYKENVDDIRESPTLQMLDIMDNHLSGGLVQVYDPYVIGDIVPNQHHDLQSFLDSVDMVVIMVGHDEIVENRNLLENKVVFDTRHVLRSEGICHL